MHPGSPDTPNPDKSFQCLVGPDSPAGSEDLDLDLIHTSESPNDICGFIEWIDVHPYPDVPPPDLQGALTRQHRSLMVHCERPCSKEGRVSLKDVFAIQYRTRLGVDCSGNTADSRSQAKQDPPGRFKLVAGVNDDGCLVDE